MEAPRNMDGQTGEVVLRFVDGADPAMRRVADLCYETLHRPFGVVRCDEWNEMDPASLHLVALDGATVAGYARLIADGRWAHVRQVAVGPAYRRRGLATALVETLVQDAQRRGMEGVFLHARQRAVGMYERLGFRIASDAFRMPRTWLPHVRMERPFR